MGKFNEYTQKATPADNDTMMIYDAAAKANKLSPFSGIWNWIVGKLTNAVISNLQTNNKSVVGALNELNSNRPKNVGNITRVSFRSGQNGIKNIYIDFYDANNVKASLSFVTDGQKGIRFLINEETVWQINAS